MAIFSLADTTIRQNRISFMATYPKLDGCSIQGNMKDIVQSKKYFSGPAQEVHGIGCNIAYQEFIF